MNLQDIINNFNENPNFKTKHSVEMSRRKRKVYQYDIEGKLVAEYDSILEACKKTGLIKQNIMDAFKSKSRFSHGYFWSNSKNDTFDLNKEGAHGRGYLVYDMNGNLLGRYDTQKQIRETYNLNAGSVSLVLTGKRPHTKNFIIKYEK